MHPLFSNTLQSSYAFCRGLSHRSGSNFYLGFLLLPREKRRAMHALYAFMRYSDDLVDVALPPEPDANHLAAINRQREKLRHWRTLLENALAGSDSTTAHAGVLSSEIIPDTESTALSLLPALLNTVQKFHIPGEHLFAVLDGVEMDLHQRRYETFDDLRLYCQRVASAVGLACIYIWGFRGQGTPQGDAAFEPARQAGIALQLTNILRDLKTDAARDRVYLSVEDIRSSGYSLEELKKGIVNAAFLRLMALQINRAEQFYREGYKLMDYLDRDGQRIFGLMMSTYWSLLKKIAHRPQHVFSRPIRLSINHRLSLLARWALLPSAMIRLMKKQVRLKM